MHCVVKLHCESSLSVLHPGAPSNLVVQESPKPLQQYKAIHFLVGKKGQELNQGVSSGTRLP
jgi:hypothetical protein